MRVLMHTVIVLIASMLGGFTQTVTGFGCGIVIMLFLPYIMSVVQASGLSVLITMILNVLLVVRYRKSIRMGLVFPPAIISFAVSTLAIFIGANLELNVMKVIFSLFLIALALYFIFFSDKIQIQANPPTVLICASLAGVANGLFGIGGPPMALYFLTVTREKEEYVGTTQMYFLLTSAYTTVIRILSGVFDRQLLLMGLPGILAILLGSYIGMRIVDRISHEKMKRVIYLFLIASGLITLVQTL